MEIIIIAVTSLLASLLTFFSGFGLGTILTPVFAIFFPIDLAIALTAVVHFLNNIFKLFLVGKHINKDILVKFGITAVIGAFLGAYLLMQLSGLKPLLSYTINDRIFKVTLVKSAVALLIVLFALMEALPSLKNIQFAKGQLPLGGFVSGFFGGLSGHQGALRSSFLIRYRLSKESFIATGISIACLVDITRLPVYFRKFEPEEIKNNLLILSLATLSAFLGAYTGSKLLHKTTLKSLQLLVTVMLFAIALLLGLGII